MTIVEKIKKEIAEFDAKKKALCEELRKEFPSLLMGLLEQSKKIESISWTQYTPYFNDGDECEFRVHNSDLYINNEYEDDTNELDFLNEKIYRKIESEEDLALNNQAAEYFKYKWYKEKQIGQGGIFMNPDRDEVECRIVKELKEVLASIDDSFYRDLFGDHVKVTVYKNGEISTDSYDHD